MRGKRHGVLLLMSLHGLLTIGWIAGSLAAFIADNAWFWLGLAVSGIFLMVPILIGISGACLKDPTPIFIYLICTGIRAFGEFALGIFCIVSIWTKSCDLQQAQQKKVPHIQINKQGQLKALSVATTPPNTPTVSDARASGTNGADFDPDICHVTGFKYQWNTVIGSTCLALSFMSCIWIMIILEYYRAIKNSTNRRPGFSEEDILAENFENRGRSSDKLPDLKSSRSHKSGMTKYFKPGKTQGTNTPSEWNEHYFDDEKKAISLRMFNHGNRDDSMSHGGGVSTGARSAAYRSNQKQPENDPAGPGAGGVRQPSLNTNVEGGENINIDRRRSTSTDTSQEGETAGDNPVAKNIPGRKEHHRNQRKPEAERSTGNVKMAAATQTKQQTNGGKFFDRFRKSPKTQQTQLGWSPAKLDRGGEVEFDRRRREKTGASGTEMMPKLANLGASQSAQPIFQYPTPTSVLSDYTSGGSSKNNQLLSQTANKLHRHQHTPLGVSPQQQTPTPMMVLQQKNRGGGKGFPIKKQSDGGESSDSDEDQEDKHCNTKNRGISKVVAKKSASI